MEKKLPIIILFSLNKFSKNSFYVANVYKLIHLYFIIDLKKTVYNFEVNFLIF
jgi:hypothetical protein